MMTKSLRELQKDVVSAYAGIMSEWKHSENAGLLAETAARLFPRNDITDITADIKTALEGIARGRRFYSACMTTTCEEHIEKVAENAGSDHEKSGCLFGIWSLLNKRLIVEPLPADIIDFNAKSLSEKMDAILKLLDEYTAIADTSLRTEINAAVAVNSSISSASRHSISEKALVMALCSWIVYRNAGCEITGFAPLSPAQFGTYAGIAAQAVEDLTCNTLVASNIFTITSTVSLTLFSLANALSLYLACIGTLDEGLSPEGGVFAAAAFGPAPEIPLSVSGLAAGNMLSDIVSQRVLLMSLEVESSAEKLQRAILQERNSIQDDKSSVAAASEITSRIPFNYSEDNDFSRSFIELLRESAPGAAAVSPE